MSHYQLQNQLKRNQQHIEALGIEYNYDESAMTPRDYETLCKLRSDCRTLKAKLYPADEKLMNEAICKADRLFNH